MGKPIQQSPLYFALDQQMLEKFVDALNAEKIWTWSQDAWKPTEIDCRPVQQHLRNLVKAWFLSGPNLKKQFRSNRDLHEYARDMRMNLIPTNNGRALLDYEIRVEGASFDQPKFLALRIFYGFLLHPDNGRLAGPCNRCSNFFLKRNAQRRRTYCSKACAHMKTAIEAHQRERDKERDTRIKKVRSRLRDWPGKKKAPDWKKWLVNDYPALSRHWITRAVNRGDIIAPM